MLTSIYKLITLAIISAVLAIPGVASAGTYMNAQTIKYVATGWSGEGVYVDTVEGETAPEGCLENARGVIKPDEPLFREMVSILITALHSGHKVRFYVDGCLNDRLRIKAVGIER